MKIKVLTAVFLILASLAIGCCEAYLPHEGVFAYTEVENYTLNDFNFTIPSMYNPVFNNATHMFFTSANSTLNLSVVDGAKIHEVNSSKNVTASYTMFGSVDGYLVNRNGSYSFSFYENETLITVSSKDMTLMVGVIGKD